MNPTILSSDAPPPLTWATQDPDWYTPGTNLTIDADTGRICGEVQPPPGEAHFIGPGPNHGVPVPGRYPDEDFCDFHIGSMPFVDEDGTVVQVATGSLAAFGGHSANIQASGVDEGRDWLQRRNRWKQFEDDLVGYGKITRVEGGPRDGALIFRGSVFPWTTREEAAIINATTVSGENWPHPDHGGQLQFIGPARVRQTSFRYQHPLVMAADMNPADGPVWAVPVNAPAEEAVMAELSEVALSEIRRMIDDLSATVAQNEADTTDIVTRLMRSDQIAEDQWRADLTNRVEEFGERLGRLEQLLERLDSSGEEEGGESGPIGTVSTGDQNRQGIFR